MSASIVERAGIGHRANRPGGRATLRGSDQRRPIAIAHQPGTPGGRPGQPTRPISRTVINLGQRTIHRAATVDQDHAHLNDRVLALLVIGFLLALSLGATVVVGQFLAISDGPAGTPGQVAAGAPGQG